MNAMPSSLAKMCNRLAAETTRAKTNQLAWELRQEFSKRLQQGADVVVLEDELVERTMREMIRQVNPQRI